MGLLPNLEFLEDPGFDGEAAAVREWYAMNSSLRENSAVWITTRRDEFELRKRDGSPYMDEDGQPLTARVYHIQGIFSTEELGASACRDESYLLGALPLNVSLPHDAVIWEGAYFPRRRAVAPLPFWQRFAPA